MPFERKYKNNIFLIALCVVAVGFVTGCLYVGFFCGGRLSQICAVYKTSFEGEVEVFRVIGDALFFTGSVFLLGFSLFGFWFCNLFLFLKAMNFGIAASACFCLNGVRGALTVATAILPYSFLFLLALSLFCVEATDLSYHAYRATDRAVLKNLIKRYFAVGGTLFVLTSIPVLWRIFLVPVSIKYIG